LRFVCFTVCFSLGAAVVSAQPEAVPAVEDLQVLLTKPPANPQNARELAMMREYYDKTVWADEVIAQRYERTAIDLWDRFIHNNDKYEVLANTAFNQLVVNTTQQTQRLDWKIFLSEFTGPKKTILRSEWKSLLDKFQKAGFEIIETEWHHSEFHPPKDGPARSVISMVMLVKQPAKQRRLIVKGDLKITWSAEISDGTPPLYMPEIIDATGLRVTHRDGNPAFEETMQLKFQVDLRAKSHPETIHPVILHDLNGDQLSEVIVAGYNEVYWNEGNWEFTRERLCDHPSKLVNAAVLADFTGDGVTDLLCALKNGFPQLYEGTSGGKFSAPPRELKIAEKYLRLPVGMTAGDIDGDGDLDVFIGQIKGGYQAGGFPVPYWDANDSFPSFLLENDGHGNFRNVIDQAGLAKKSHRRNYAASLVDLDHDGDLDLLLTNDFCGNDLFLNDGRGKFIDVSKSLKPRSYAYGMSHTFGDYNLDATLDFLTIGMSSTTARRLNKLQLGRPDFAEYNRQRANMGYGNRLYLNKGRLKRGQGFLQAPFNDQVARTGWSWGSTTLDFDRDGDQDVYVCNGQISGKTTLDYCTRFWCHDIYFRAEDRPDAAIKDFFRGLSPLFGNAFSWNGFEHNALLMNLKGNGFINVGFLMDCASVLDSRAAVSGDLDLDGRVDLIYEHNDMHQNEAVLHFLRNRWEDDHHWVGVHLLPNAACSNTLGAKVAVQLDDGRVLLQHRLSGHSVWVQHADTLHFGMGKTAKIRRISVRWPNGARSTLQAPVADKYHVLQPEVE